MLTSCTRSTRLRGLLDDYTSSLQALQWEAASAHFCGAGLEGGVDNQSLRFFAHSVARCASWEATRRASFVRCCRRCV
eukprot:7576152-Pyramimonas_sp.AAC.1